MTGPAAGDDVLDRAHEHLYIQCVYAEERVKISAGLQLAICNFSDPMHWFQAGSLAT